jgi:Lon protease-like protein
MVLPRCSLLPHGLLPLFIFEPRYQDMLQHALQNERLFSVGMRSTHEEDESDDAIHHHSSLAMVRACVHHDDGTSHLILQGVQRIRFTGWHQRTPFRMARFEVLGTVVSEPREIPELHRQVMAHVCRRVSGADGVVLKKKMKGICDPEIFADFAAANFLTDHSQRHRILGMCDLNERLRFLAETLASA